MIKREQNDTATFNIRSYNIGYNMIKSTHDISLHFYKPGYGNGLGSQHRKVDMIQLLPRRKKHLQDIMSAFVFIHSY